MDRLKQFSLEIAEIFGNLRRAVADFTDKSNAESIVATFRNGFNQIFEYVHSAWGPQMDGQLRFWLGRWNGYFSTYPQEYARLWNAAMDSMHGPPVVPGGGTGSSTTTPPPREWNPFGDGPTRLGPAVAASSSGGGGGNGAVYSNCVFLGDGTVLSGAPQGVVDFFREALTHKQGASLGPTISN